MRHDGDSYSEQSSLTWPTGELDEQYYHNALALTRGRDIACDCVGCDELASLVDEETALAFCSRVCWSLSASKGIKFPKKAGKGGKSGGSGGKSSKGRGRSKSRGSSGKSRSKSRGGKSRSSSRSRSKSRSGKSRSRKGSRSSSRSSRSRSRKGSRSSSRKGSRSSSSRGSKSRSRSRNRSSGRGSKSRSRSSSRGNSLTRKLKGRGKSKSRRSSSKKDKRRSKKDKKDKKNRQDSSDGGGGQQQQDDRQRVQDERQRLQDERQRLQDERQRQAQPSVVIHHTTTRVYPPRVIAPYRGGTGYWGSRGFGYGYGLGWSWRYPWFAAAFPYQYWFPWRVWVPQYVVVNQQAVQQWDSSGGGAIDPVHYQPVQEFGATQLPRLPTFTELGIDTSAIRYDTQSLDPQQQARVQDVSRRITLELRRLRADHQIEARMGYHPVPDMDAGRFAWVKQVQ